MHGVVTPSFTIDSAQITFLQGQEIQECGTNALVAQSVNENLLVISVANIFEYPVTRQLPIIKRSDVVYEFPGGQEGEAFQVTVPPPTDTNSFDECLQAFTQLQIPETEESKAADPLEYRKWMRDQARTKADLVTKTRKIAKGIVETMKANQEYYQTTLTSTVGAMQNLQPVSDDVVLALLMYQRETDEESFVNQNGFLGEIIGMLARWTNNPRGAPEENYFVKYLVKSAVWCEPMINANDGTCLFDAILVPACQAEFGKANRVLSQSVHTDYLQGEEGPMLVDFISRDDSIAKIVDPSTKEMREIRLNKIKYEEFKYDRQDEVDNGFLCSFEPVLTNNLSEFYDKDIYMDQMLAYARAVNDEFGEYLEKDLFAQYIESQEGSLFHLPVKSRDRSRDKCDMEFNAMKYPTAAHMCDFMRCSITFKKVRFLIEALEHVINMARRGPAEGASGLVGIARLQNLMAQLAGIPADREMPHRDIQIQAIYYSAKGGKNMIVEIKLVLPPFVAFKKSVHRWGKALGQRDLMGFVKEMVNGQ